MPVAVGVLLGGLGVGVPWGLPAADDLWAVVVVLGVVAATAVGAALVLSAAAALAARLLAPTLRAATDPDHLRVAG